MNYYKALRYYLLKHDCKDKKYTEKYFMPFSINPFSLSCWCCQEIAKPSESDLVDVESTAALTEEYNQLNYQFERTRGDGVIYPEIGDQLDMIYHDKINGTNIWATTIANVKTLHPKLLPTTTTTTTTT